MGAWTSTPSGRAALLVLSAALIAAAIVASLGGSGLAHHRDVAVPPTPARPSSVAPSAVVSTPASDPVAAPFQCPVAARTGTGVAPDSICIPTLRVSTSVMSLGLNADGTVQVPPLSKVGEAGWYRESAAPGAVGPTVVLGHIDSAQYGDGVFFRLSSLRPGDQVQLAREDGRIAVFRINTVIEVSKKAFPSEEVYGPTSGPAIRLVTCGGKFDAATRNYEDNIVAFGTLLRLT